MEPFDRRRRGLLLPAARAVCCAVLLSIAMMGCKAKRPPGLPEPVAPIDVLAVMPVAVGGDEPGSAARPPEAQATVGAERPPPVPREAGMAITAQIYAVLSDRSSFRFVPDLQVSEALESDIDGGNEVERAVKLGKAVKADAVLIGTVSRFRERIGNELGAREPAAVSFSLALVEVKTGAVIWRGSFDKRQEALSSNLFDWWMFWRGGPRWFSARELARIGIERLIDDMEKTVR